MPAYRWPIMMVELVGRVISVGVRGGSVCGIIPVGVKTDRWMRRVWQ
jgi:hypothetical protein